MSQVQRPHILVCFLLVTVAALLKRSLQVFLFIYCSIAAAIVGELGKYWWDLACSIDMNGNVLGSYYWNDWLIEEGGYQFGNKKEVMSSAFGKNEMMNNKFKFQGKVIKNTLNTIEENHCIKAIDNNV